MMRLRIILFVLLACIYTNMSAENYYVREVKLNFPALIKVLEADIIPYVQVFSFMPPTGYISVDISDNEVRIISGTERSTYSPYWDDSTVSPVTNPNKGVFKLNGIPIRVLNRGSRYVESAGKTLWYVYNTDHYYPLGDEIEGPYRWRYIIENDELILQSEPPNYYYFKQYN